MHTLHLEPAVQAALGLGGPLQQLPAAAGPVLLQQPQHLLQAAAGVVVVGLREAEAPSVLPHLRTCRCRSAPSALSAVTIEMKACFCSETSTRMWLHQPALHKWQPQLTELCSRT